MTQLLDVFDLEPIDAVLVVVAAVLLGWGLEVWRRGD